MQGEMTKIIAQYLSGELSESDRKIFEERLATNETLKQEVALQLSVMEAAKRAAIRTQVVNASKSFHINQTLKWGGIALGIIAVVTSLSVLLYQQATKTETNDLAVFSELIEDVKDNSLIGDLPSEFFLWNGKDTAMLTKGGILISIPESAFLLNGKPYTENALIQFQEALDPATIVKSGLSTMADDRLLETQGMFSFTALSKDGEQLTVNPKTGVYIQVPVDEYKKGMQLFTGETGKDGIINWVNPKALAKIPVPVDMHKLNFYPPGYEDSLNQMKLRKDKKYRDSLYLSCEIENPFEKDTISKEPNRLDSKTEVVIIDFPDCETTFPGGYDALLKFINANTQYPEKAIGEGLYGRVYVSFSVDEKGSIFSPKVTKGIHPLLDNEAIRLVNSMPLWNPALKNGTPVISQVNLPIKFSIDGLDKASNSSSNNRDKSPNWKEHIKWEFSIEYLPNNEAIIVGKATLKNDWHIFSTTHDPKKADNTGYPTKFIFPKSTSYTVIGELIDGEMAKIANDELGITKYFENSAIFKQKIKIKNDKSFNLNFDYSFQICDKNGCLFPPDQSATLIIIGKINNILPSNVFPSSVLAFWQPKFNNTILATREFEKRMQAIHGTCNNKVLEMYTQNLDKAIAELDQKVVKMGYSNFEAFAAENVGALNPTNPHLKGLKDFYEKAITSLQQEAKNYREKEQKRRAKWDKEIDGERTKETTRAIQRENQAFNEEYTLNHKNVRKQLGRTLGTTIYTNAVICNIDRFVMATTIARKTGEFYDVPTGKTARIQYNEFSLEVENAGSYEKVFVYLFPSELNSFQRISGTNGKFDYPLNDAIIYDVAIVGISEKGYSYFQRSMIKGGKLGKVNLEHVSEAKLNASIEQLNRNRISKPMQIKDELNWLIKEQKNYVERSNRQKQYVFHERIKKIVFPCYESASLDTIKVENGIPFEI